MSADLGVENFPALSALLNRQLSLTPQHSKSLKKRFLGCDEAHLALAEIVAQRIVCVAGDDLDRVLMDYDWICQLMFREEVQFRRSGRYRLATFQDAVAEVYSNDELMRHYMNGLLISQLWWSNHTETFQFYRDVFLARFVDRFDHLEIGPGHGLLLFEAGQRANCASLEGWDVSASSVAQTREALHALGLEKRALLVVQDLFEADASQKTFDSIVLSEVLEHLEAPEAALKVVKQLLKPDGALFVNMPVNSPAPDHIFLLTAPEDVVALVERCGFRVTQSHFAPQTGVTLERARALNSTISVAIVAQVAA